MTEIDWTWFASRLKTWTKWQLMGSDLVYSQDLADGLLGELDQQRWELIQSELAQRGYKYRKNKWVRKRK
jgi:hypothetical protein